MTSRTPNQATYTEGPLRRLSQKISNSGPRVHRHALAARAIDAMEAERLPH